MTVTLRGVGRGGGVPIDPSGRAGAAGFSGFQWVVNEERDVGDSATRDRGGKSFSDQRIQAELIKTNRVDGMIYGRIQHRMRDWLRGYSEEQLKKLSVVAMNGCQSGPR